MSEISEERKRQIRAEEEERLRQRIEEDRYREQVRRELAEEQYRQAVRTELEAGRAPAGPAPDTQAPLDRSREAPPVAPSQPPSPRVVPGSRTRRSLAVYAASALTVAGAALCAVAVSRGFRVPWLGGASEADVALATTGSPVVERARSLPHGSEALLRRSADRPRSSPPATPRAAGAAPAAPVRSTPSAVSAAPRPFERPVVSSTRSPAPSAPRDGWVRTGPSNGAVTLEVPAGWRIQSGDNWVEAKMTEAGGLPPASRLVYVALHGARLSPPADLARFEEQIRADLVGSPAGGTRPVIRGRAANAICGLPAVVLLVDTATGEFAGRMIAVLFVAGDTGWVLSFHAPIEGYERHLATFDRVQSSVSVRRQHGG